MKYTSKLILNGEEYEFAAPGGGGGTPYTISNIPTDDSNVYVNVGQSGKTIQSVKFSFTSLYQSASAVFVSISSNNSSSDRFGIALFNYLYNGSGLGEGINIRGRLSGVSDSFFALANTGYVSQGTNAIEFTINRNGLCTVICNGQTNTYNADSTALNIIETIMNLSDMNVYASQQYSTLSGDNVDVEVTYS